MISREVTIIKNPIGFVIKVSVNNEPSTSILLEPDEWEWVQGVTKDMDVGEPASKTFVL